MLTLEEIKKTIAELIENLGEKVLEITAMPSSGSSRLYFRVKTDKRYLIGAYNINIEENDAFFSFSKHFHECGLPVPEILAISSGKDVYVQTDLGDDTLFKHVEKCLEEGKYDDETIGLYKKSLDKLIDFQTIGHKGLDYSKAFPTPAFDEMSIMEDLNYFKYCFLKEQEEISFNETRLDGDFQRLAKYILEAPSDFFMYRDFQSRNIMICNGEPYFIDYQGGRKGPLQYDVVSLLYQVKARLPENLRKDLINYYKQQLSVKGCHSERSEETPTAKESLTNEFDRYFPAFVLLRLLQVLGAYGFRGLIQKKLHFMQSIPYAIRELMKVNEKWELPFELPELQGVLQQLSIVLQKYESIEPEVLTITVNSFSYKNGGVPYDKSGNGGGFVFDCRALPNPGRYVEFKKMNGEDAEVKDFLNDKPDTHYFLQNVQLLVYQSIDNYLERGFKNLQINFGCTGGQHRSVYFAQTIGELIHENYPMVRVEINHLAQHISHVYEAE
ncbi:MAG: phosphotransferase [Bacteroidales bacterium]|nr:phosphotransferase [Bacteroidales bacterium]